jgi:tripartite-type tricarboxylate transporter receptor subunit TctC
MGLIFVPHMIQAIFSLKLGRIALPRSAVALLMIASAIACARAADFPSHVVTIVSPYQAGGTSDIIARLVAQKLSERWGQSVIVENRPGANGGIGVSDVAKAMPDGHTLLAVASSALTINPLFYKSLPYDVDRNLTPITATGRVANVLVVNPAVPAENVQQLIDLARAKPGQLSYASQGVGSNGHVTGELFKQRAGVDILHVPYKGSTPAVQDLLGGQVQLMFDNMPTVLPMIRAGKLRALAVTTIERSPELPDTPTIAESGLAGFDTSAWFALLTAKTVPKPVQAEIEHSAVAVLNTPDARERLKSAGIDIAADGSAALGRQIADETRMWRDVVSKAGIKPE